ncbi:hypothetical protein [Mycolicibacterium sp. J2]|uniref:hypothetical protein n=1 Tax=Mycolicibacterium sp. J2 TaxID=2993511 RepID=UPI00224A85A8|nr:hypothetical protein [Mycolicibacterium sp. J2]MCX2712041.1 hypothetical protein [Mycolicibacterium sp. J2]
MKFNSMEELLAAHRAGNGDPLPVSVEEYRRLEVKVHAERLNSALERLNAGETDWKALSYMMGDRELPTLLYYVWPRLPPDQLIKAVGNAWTHGDVPEKHFPRREWLPIFRAAGYHEDEARAEPPDRITLWRGGVRRTGMAWTADRERAEWFQHRWDAIQPGKLWTVTVKAERLLAHYHGEYRREDEYVIDATGLRPREVVA